MLEILVHDILPVFAILALGFALGRVGTFSTSEAAAVNRVSFLVLQPALIFPLIAGIDTSAFRTDALAAYAGCEALAFALAYLVARRVFARDRAEAWFLAMAVVFVNSLLYIWPVANLIYDPDEVLPITAIVAWDSSVTFAFFIVGADLVAGRGRTARSLGRVARNPVLIAILAGAVINLAGWTAPGPLLTYAGFVGAGAAPLTLFALGVVLSSHKLRPGPVVAAMSALKLVAFPLLAAGALAIVAPPEEWRGLMVLNAAGPSGAMAFALALLHGVRTDAVAPVIVWTSLLSLISLAWLA